MQPVQLKELLLTIALTITLAACKPGGEAGLTIVGSDTMVELSQALASGFAETTPGQRISVRGGGSGIGIAAILNGSADIAAASRKLSAKEVSEAKQKRINLKEHVVALDGVAVICNRSNPVQKLSLKQLSDIFAGKITNWQQVGGVDQPILVISRENNSGTHVYFKQEVVKRFGNDREYAPLATYAVSSQQIVDQVQQHSGAIGYVGMGWMSKNVKIIELEKQGSTASAPSVATIRGGEYPLARPLHMYSRQKTAQKSRPFIDYVLSAAGQNIALKMGFVNAHKI